MWKWTKIIGNVNQRIFKANYSESKAKTIKACIVGSGPAGFYSAQYILKHLPNSHVDIIEKLPVPFGLVRFGVAPDHPEVKNVINTFTKTAEHPNFRFIGNVSVGTDITLQELRNCYDIVLLAYGANIDAKLNIPGEDKRNVLSAREFVGWYNGQPNLDKLNPDLSGESAVLLGQGNVAVDVARILLSTIDDLRKTDITEHALEALSKSRVKKVYLVGRRGPLQAAFTIKELREMLKLPNVDTNWRSSDFVNVKEQVESLPRPRKRITELMIKSLEENKSNEGNKNFLPIFYRSPLQINGESNVESVDLTITKVVDNKAIPTEDVENIPAQLVCRSIGYKSVCIDDAINFDDKRGMIKNTNGRVLQKDANTPDIGLYVAGWLGTGPTGVILTTMNNAFAVSQTIIDDVHSGAIKCDSTKPGLDPKKYNVVTWSDWEKIDKREIENGKKSNKPREKRLSIEEMMKIVKS
ncbi:CLUMA_CG013734, isoform A [Clunio marinus]|uniref:NADPH:adrenodoxin oxidoreductase, mitochondrial n=1 Tax=Clunio marinus TaxID=568069 RepID=A0A1J1IJV3_9DIPT|nr:CLUMA_CG013734, isoform A [Clunio marinus]